jgi:hypothetical protein
VRSRAECCWCTGKGECGVCESVERDEELATLRTALAEAVKERDAAADAFLRCALAIGVAHEPESGPCAPGPIDDVEHYILAARQASMDHIDCQQRAKETEQVIEAARAGDHHGWRIIDYEAVTAALASYDRKGE